MVTPAKFLHEFKDTDDVRHDPKPELSVYLPGALVGAPAGDKFSVKGKDSSKTFSSKLSGSSELSFKAHSAADAERWFKIIKDCAEAAMPTSPISPTSAGAGSGAPQSPVSPADTSAGVSRAATDEKMDADAKHAAQETGVTGEGKSEKA